MIWFCCWVKKDQKVKVKIIAINLSVICQHQIHLSYCPFWRLFTESRVAQFSEKLEKVNFEKWPKFWKKNGKNFWENVIKWPFYFSIFQHSGKVAWEILIFPVNFQISAEIFRELPTEREGGHHHWYHWYDTIDNRLKFYKKTLSDFSMKL